jgi:hypothetical protein
MNGSERQKYVEKSSKQSADTSPKRYTSFGVSFDEIDKQKENVKKEQKKMEFSIKDMLTQATVEGSKLKFEPSRLQCIT